MLITRATTTLLLSCLLLVLPSRALDCPRNEPRTASALIDTEQRWAKALERHDQKSLACLLSDEFQDADPVGKLHSRAETLAAVPQRKPGTNQLSELQPHIYREIGYIRGLATLLNPDGSARAQVRFTDIYIYRDGRWQALAGQETLVPETK